MPLSTPLTLHPLLIYLALINLVTFVVYGLDKAASRTGSWRVSERVLLLLLAVGGTLGALAGMSFFRHKTKKNSFGAGVAITLLIQVGALFLYLRYAAP